MKGRSQAHTYVLEYKSDKGNSKYKDPEAGIRWVSSRYRGKQWDSGNECMQA